MQLYMSKYNQSDPSFKSLCHNYNSKFSTYTWFLELSINVVGPIQSAEDPSVKVRRRVAQTELQPPEATRQFMVPNRNRKETDRFRFRIYEPRN